MAGRKILFLAGLGFLANLAMFGAYRLIFLWQFAPGLSWIETRQVFWGGLRLDLALLGFEFCATGLISLLLRGLKPRKLFLWFWLLTGAHLLICVANLSTFAERNQNAGELLMPYLTSPYQIYLSVIPFCQSHWILICVLIGSVGFFFWAGFRFSRKFTSEKIDLWGNKKIFLCTLAISILPIVLTLQPVITKRAINLMGVKFSGQGWSLRWKLKISESKYFATFSRYALNQAVLNPLLEFLQLQIPSYFRNYGRFRLSEIEALKIWNEISGRNSTDAQYPLLTTIHGRTNSRIQNVILIQVEGFSQSVLEREENGRFVMPFVRKLSQGGLYFPNTFQCADFTSGECFYRGQLAESFL